MAEGILDGSGNCSFFKFAALRDLYIKPIFASGKRIGIRKKSRLGKDKMLGIIQDFQNSCNNP